jgi:hypothetical protein
MDSKLKEFLQESPRIILAVIIAVAIYKPLGLNYLRNK